MYKNKRVIAVIPAYNEGEYIGMVVGLTKKYVDEIIVVDDGSVDKTAVIAYENGAIVLRHAVNLGLGSALKTGCDGAYLLGADIIITLDGDGQHDPEDIPVLLDKLLKEDLDIVFGERNFNGDMPFVKKIGNKFFSIFFKYIFQSKLKDTQSGFRVFKRETYKKIRWESFDYAVASEILINTQKNNLKYSPQNIKTIYHENHKGTTFIDGLKITNKIAGMRFK